MGWKPVAFVASKPRRVVANPVLPEGGYSGAPLMIPRADAHGLLSGATVASFREGFWGYLLRNSPTANIRLFPGIFET